MILQASFALGHGLADLYALGAAVLDHALQRLVAGGDRVVQRGFAAVDGLNGQ